jgi:hypothetical protein
MVLSDLTSADFEPVDQDSNGNFSFTTALLKLRRSILGLHNKVFPVYIMNSSIPFSLVAGGNGALQTKYTVPDSKTLNIYTFGVLDVGGITAGYLYAADGTTIKGYSNGTVAIAPIQINSRSPIVSLRAGEKLQVNVTNTVYYCVYGELV